MLQKIIFYIFLIIAFSSYGFCIRNKELNNGNFYKRNKLENPYTLQQLQVSNEAFRKNFYDREDTVGGESSKITFPDKQQESNIYHYVQNEIPQNNVNINYKPYLNTNARQTLLSAQSLSSPSSVVSPLQYPYDDRTKLQRPITEGYFDSVGNYPYYSKNTVYKLNGNNVDLSNYYSLYNDLNYNQNNQYAHSYSNYQHSHSKNRPNYNGTPTTIDINSISTRPRQFHQRYTSPQSPYRYENYEAPYRLIQQPLNSLPSRYYPTTNGPYYPAQQQPHYYPPSAPPYNDGHQASYFGNPLSNFLSNAASPTGFLGNQFTRALEDIARNDDLECVPRLLCSMIGDPERRAHLPAFLSSPGFSSLIAVLPPTSPALVFGKAALLGLTGGEESCYNTYARCPSNEDELLYYLNNHRGGFFRFFNGGEAFGDDSEHYTSSQYQQKPSSPDYQQSSQNSQNQGGFNLANLASNLGFISNLASLLPMNQNSGQSSIGNIVGNILSGYLGGQSKSRRKIKRDISSNFTSLIDDEEEELSIKNSTEIIPKEIEEITKYKHKKYHAPSDLSNNNYSSINTTHIEGHTNISQKIEDEIEGRIINSKRLSIFSEDYDNIFPIDYSNEDKISFPLDYDSHSHRYKYQNDDSVTPIKFPIESSGHHEKYPRPYRGGKRVHFKDDRNYPHPRDERDDYYDDNDYNYNNFRRPSETIFPDRTGTGNLRFDSSHPYYSKPDQYGKILNRPSHNYDRDKDDYHSYGHNRPSSSYYYDRYRYTTTTTERPYYAHHNSNYDYNRYRHDRITTPRPFHYNQNHNSNYNNNYYHDKYGYRTTTTKRPSGSSDQNIYVTNSKGIVEYYINPRGDKIYI